MDRPMEYNLLLAGLVLIVIEIIVPGFGLFGLAGLGALTVGSFLIMGGGMKAFLILLAIYAVLAVIVLLVCFYFPSKSKWNPFVLWEKQKNEQGYTGSSDFSALLDKTAVTLTPLRPAGTAEVEGERVDVSSFGDYIDKGVAVRIVKIEGSKIFVKKI